MRKATLVTVLLVAAVFRLYGLNNVSPPGLAHDEVAHWLINQSILAGQHAVYFTEAYGHEAGFHYVQALFQVLLGDHTLSLRLPAAFAGLLSVAVAFALGRRLFGWQAGLLSAAFLAVLFWPIFFSRLALRAIALPLVAGLSVYCWWQGWVGEWRSRKAEEQLIWFALAGVLSGLSLHTYMAARALPIFYGLFTLYLFLFHRPRFRQVWRGVAVFWLLFAAIAAPLVIYLVNHPQSEFRITEVDAPLRALQAGDLRPVLANSIKILGMVGFRGDPLWRQNVARWPVFEPLLAFAFYAGVALALWRWRDARYAFLLLWFLASAAPSIVTIDAPSSIRLILLLPVLMLFPAVFIHSLSKLFTVWENLSTGVESGKWRVESGEWRLRQFVLRHGPRNWEIERVGGRRSPVVGHRLVGLALIALFLFHGWRTAYAFLRIWPADEEVQFVWQAALTEAARYLDGSAATGPVAIGGWTPETMDPPTMELTLRREDLRLRFFDPREGIILPGEMVNGQRSMVNGQSEEPQSRIVRPGILPFHPLVEDSLGRLGAEIEEGDGFVVYRLAGPVVRPQFPVEATFGNELQLLGYDVDEPCEVSACAVATYWRVVGKAAGPRRLFLHVLDETGELLDQDDGLGAPAADWQAGDLIVQVLELESLPSGSRARIGVYHPVTQQRLLTESGDEFITLPFAMPDAQ
jgi:4-amino-4-deoxy-L-arabinose transferase-like glycosyltransferase